MDLTFTEKEKRFRAEAREWLEAEVPRESLGSGDTRDGFRAHVEWERRLFEGGWSVVSWPRAYGGREATLTEWLIFEEEYYRAGAPNRVTQNGIFLLAPSVFSYGSAEQKERLLRPMASAEVLWCQGWSEPNAGSDLANVGSHATAGDGGWYLTGQKTWCTRGAFCDAVYGLFRTDPDSSRHRGLSYFLIDFDRPGVTVRGMGRLDGDEGFAEVFFDEVFVTESDLLGEVDQGWAVAMSTTSSERGLSLRSPGRFMASAARLRRLLHRNSNEIDPLLAERLARVCIYVFGFGLFCYHFLDFFMV
jgi:alkylation response protein AidB-like acyl-CoA dehydrogenase